MSDEFTKQILAAIRRREAIRRRKETLRTSGIVSPKVARFLRALRATEGLLPQKPRPKKPV